MTNDIENYMPFMQWTVEVAEEKILEHKLLQNAFNTHEEFIIFTIIWLRVYKFLLQDIKGEKLQKNVRISTDKYIKNFYINQNNQFLGITINAISRESEIPRTTVKRYVEKLILKNLVKRNLNNLIIPTSKVRDFMKNYRKYIFKSNKKIYKIYKDLDLENIHDSEEHL